MAVDFNKFDKMVDNKQLKEDIANASDQQYDDVPKGTYLITIEKMEVKQTKAKDKLMFSVQAKIKETIEAPKKQDGRWIFFNRVICGNRTTEKWNDGAAIKGVITWIRDLADEELEFESYSQFAEDVESLFEDIKSSVEAQVKYDADAFNPITIEEVFDI